jgi:hypothetical protein
VESKTAIDLESIPGAPASPSAVDAGEPGSRRRASERVLRSRGGELMVEPGDDLDVAMRALVEAEQVLARARQAIDPSGSHATIERVRPMIRKVEAALASLARAICEPGASTGPIELARSAAFVRSPDGTVAVLEHRGSLRRMLALLVEARTYAPGVAVDHYALRDAGWPGERMLEGAARQRVRTALAVLRRSGLRRVLRGDARGWYLDPSSDVLAIVD